MGGPGLRLCLAGAPLDTGNRGVEALSRSVLAATAREAPGSTVTVLDNGWGVRVGPQLEQLRVELSGVRRSRRVYRRESWTNVRLSQHLRGVGNPVARSLLRSDAVLDISGGDSFTDIYGPGRLQTVLAPKLAALRSRRPLVLLPQTYGPFAERTSTLAPRKWCDELRWPLLVTRRATRSWSISPGRTSTRRSTGKASTSPSGSRHGALVARNTPRSYASSKAHDRDHSPA